MPRTRMTSRALASSWILAVPILFAACANTTKNILEFDGTPLGGLQLDPHYLHYLQATRDGSPRYPEHAHATVAYRWLDILQETTAREVEEIGARPTIISRQMAIPLTAMYDAWAAYDERAVGTRLGSALRRPVAERTQRNREIAIAHAMCRTLLDLFPKQADYVRSAMRSMGHDPDEATRDPATAAGVGNLVADALIEYRRHDGANQHGDMPGGAVEAYADYTGYAPKNAPDEIVDPDAWQPKVFTLADGRRIAPGGLTPQWGKVTPFALDSSAQFRPGPPPRVGDPRLRAEVDEVIRYHATLTPRQKAIVEFMRDGPRSTGQSGHWLRFAQDLSRRDGYDLEQDVKLFFCVANVCMDTFIACWDAKYVFDSSRPMTLVRHFYAGQQLPGWRGPGRGVGPVRAEDWINFSPADFQCPPFPAYPSGHSTVSGGASTILRLFTGSDWFGFVAPRVPGSITGEPSDDAVLLELPSFTATAELAGISRVMGGYHIQADNLAGLELGRRVAEFSWPRYQAYFDGSASVREP
ncbi:MAG: vanadium-dependent haloperoxidase [Planctomycetota bacterium]